MYNSNELPKRRKIEPDEFADLLCSGEMVMIREPDIEKHPKHRIYRYSPKDIFVYQPKVNKQRTCISYATCLLMCRDSRTVKIETKKLFFSRKFQVQHRRILTYAKKTFIAQLQLVSMIIEPVRVTEPLGQTVFFARNSLA